MFSFLVHPTRLTDVHLSRNHDRERKKERESARFYGFLKAQQQIFQMADNANRKFSSVMQIHENKLFLWTNKN
jgi:hypothetical protein